MSVDATGEDGGGAADEPSTTIIRLAIDTPASPFAQQHAPSGDALEIVLTGNDSLNDAKTALYDSLEGVHLGAVGFYAAAAAAGGAGEEELSQAARLPEFIALAQLLEEGRLVTAPAPVRETETVDARDSLYIPLTLRYQAYTMVEARNHIARLLEQTRGFDAGYGANEVVDAGIGTLAWIAAGLGEEEAGSGGQEVVRKDSVAPAVAVNGAAKKKHKGRKKGAKVNGAGPTTTNRPSENGTATTSPQNAVPHGDLPLPPRRWPGETAFDGFDQRLSSLMDRESQADTLSTYTPSRNDLKLPSIACLEFLVVSAWDPPPAHLRMKGDLIYLTFKSLEGMRYEITSSIGGFSLNRSTESVFDPRQEGEVHKTLSHLLCHHSPLFARNFVRLQTQLAAQDPLTHSPISMHLAHPPWIVQEPQVSSQVPDPARLQDIFLQTGSRTAHDFDAARDWNEDLQSTRELPRATFAERLARDRALGRVYNDFEMAAVKGAISIARGNLLPVNPGENVKNWLWVSGNIFFTRAVDVAGIFGGADDLAHDEYNPGAVPREGETPTFPDLGSDLAAHVAASKDLAALRRIGTQDHPGICTLATALVDYMGSRWVAQGVVPGIFRREDTTRTPVGEDDHFDPLEHPNAIMYGLTEDQKQLRTHPLFAALFQATAKAFHLAPHLMIAPHSESTSTQGAKEILLSGDVKGMMGADGRKYIMECWRMSIVDAVWTEEDLDGPLLGHLGKETERTQTPRYPHRMTLLRHELVQSFWEHKMREWVSVQAAAEGRKLETGGESVDSENGETARQIRVNLEDFQLAFNPDVFTPYYEKTKNKFREQVEKDEENVRAISTYLRETIIPGFVNDIGSGIHNIPLDGLSLTRALHRRGINMRYLGKVTHLAYLKSIDSPVQDHYVALYRLCLREMCVRSVKRLARKRQSPLGTDSLGHVKALTTLLCELFSGKGPLREQVVSDVQRCYRYALPNEWFNDVSMIPTLREVALRLGIQLKARQYSLKDGEQFLTTDDILNIVPVIKTAIPKNSIAEETFEAGRQALSQENKQLAFDVLAECLQFYEQYYGVLHPETARAFANVSMLYHRSEEHSLALELQRKCTTISERVLGFDSAEVIQSILNLAMFEHLAGNHRTALVYLREGLERCFVVAGPDHPEFVSTLNNVSYILREQQRSAGKDLSSPEAQAMSLKMAQFGRWLAGQNSTHSIAYAQASQALAGVLALQGQFKTALPIQQEALKLFERHQGAESQASKEASQLVQAIVGAAVRERKMATLTERQRSNANQKASPPPPEKHNARERT